MTDPTTEAARMTIDLIPITVLLVVGVATTIGMYNFGKERGRKSALEEKTKRQEVLFRDPDYVDVVTESEDGFGIAIRDSDGGAELVKFNESDEIYQDIWIAPRELHDVANVLSVHAVEKGEFDG